MSPLAVAFPALANFVWRVSGDGRTYVLYAANPLSAFPTIYLKSNILIESGTGTSTDPYELSL